MRATAKADPYGMTTKKQQQKDNSKTTTAAEAGRCKA
jgi:hypothetical protein